MQIIKDQQLVENTWTFIADDCAFDDSGDITVTLARWLADKDQLLKRPGKTGVRLNPSNQIESLAADLANIALIELDFPMFGDGRLFSQARLLRNRDGYQGEIRAVGQYLPDQVFYLSRVGVNAFEFSNPDDINLALEAMNDFSVRYQASTN
ncbi:DUF934 domain-containing protein [Methylomonas montana]|uniref:DUF934 domain-containing protein n=1 Tax=Methylomonas montana TaxID=3058963 RepID=UPI0026589C4E|nr:DUF934 domain-containing protein [Methylomonas montana]WKJ90848.1 DUF934 domain-containing protein [Methylomonas montana]